jgi:tetratricopeptide (TPR) repeat protein
VTFRARAPAVLLAVSCLSFGGSDAAAGDKGDPCVGAELGLRAAGAALDEGRWGDAGALLEPLGVSHPDCSRVVVGQARLRADQGDPDEAERLFSRALVLAPGDAVAHAVFARFQLSRDLRPQAARLTAQALAIDPDCVEALVVQGEMLGNRGQFGEARAVLEKAVALDPNSAEAHHELGIWFFRINLFEQAARQFESAVALRPQMTRSIDYLAVSLEMLGDGDRAERLYRDALRANSGPFFDPTLDYNFGRFLLKQGRLDEAITHIERAVELFPLRRGPRYQRAKLRLAQGNFEAAREDAERALALGRPGDQVLDLQVLYLLATVYSRLGETELAEEFAQRAREAEMPESLGDGRR